MKALIQKILLKLAARAHKKRVKIEVKQQKEFMLECINLPKSQRNQLVKKKLWDYRKKMDTVEGQYVSWWCDAVKQAGKAIDALRERDKNPHLMMEEIEFHDQTSEEILNSEKQ